LGVVELLRSRELVVMWGAGLSRLGLVLRLWPLALLLVAGKFVLDDVAVPRSVPELRALRIGEFRLDRGIGGEELWLRSGPDIIRIPTLSILTGDLSDISIFARDSDGLLIERVEAASARHVEGGWLLQDVLRRPAAAAPFTAEPELFWPMAVDLAHVELMAKMPRELGWSELRAAVAADGWGIGTIDGQRTWLHGRITMALAPALTLALGFAVARRFARVGGILPVFASGLALGFGYTILNGLLLAMGELGLLHAVVAAWTTPLLTVLVILGLCGALPELRAPRRPGRLVAPRAG
jgi:lipopolysaccharide export system permease protein